MPVTTRYPNQGRGQTRLEAIVIVAAFVLLVIVAQFMLPGGCPFARVNKMSPRVACAANLRGIAQALYMYANANRDMFPVCVPLKAIDEGKVRVAYAPGLIGKNREVSDQDLAAAAEQGSIKASVTRNLWALVRLKLLGQRDSALSMFICPTGTDRASRERDPERYWDFPGYAQISYGYQVPFGRLGRPSVECDLRMPLLADKGPFGAALETGGPNPGVPGAGLNDPIEKWAAWNSPHHDGRGQNVLMPDAHVEWTLKPTCGFKGDNIYTRWSDASGGATPEGDHPAIRMHGTPPAATETPMSDTDTLLYP